MDSIADLEEDECQVVARFKPARRVEHGLPKLEGYPELEAEIRQRFLEIEEPAQNLYSLPKARLMGASYFHPLISRRDRFVLDQAAHELKQGQHPAHYAIRLPGMHKVQGTTFSLVSRWSDNYWHWLFDCIGKWLLISNSKPAGMPEVRNFAGLNLEMYSFKMQSLRSLGIASDRIVNLLSDSHCEFEELLVADLPSTIPYPEKDVINALRNAFLDRNQCGIVPKRIYISRGKSGSRRVSNEEELEALLESYGFEKVYLEDLDFLKQVALFENATAIFSQHGAGLTNLVFANAGTKVLELFEPEFVNPCYAILATKLDLDYHILFNTSSQSPTPTFHWKNIPETVEVDCSVLGELLEKKYLCNKR